MKQVIKVALPGYNAETDTDPDHFALYVNPDERIDYVLIKEQSRKTVSVSSTSNIAHGLSYIPFCLVFAEVSKSTWRKLFSVPLDGTGLWFEIDDTNLVLRNTTPDPVNFSYLIFYDRIA